MSLDLPSNRSESWRWSDLSALPELAERQPTGKMPDKLPWIDCERDGPRLLFVDGRLDESRSRLGPVKIGNTRFGPTEHPLAALAGWRGWILSLGSDHAPAGPVQVIHATTGGADQLPAAIVLAGDAQCSVVETFIGDGWANRRTDILLAPNSRLMLNRRLLGSSGFVSLTDEARLTDGASFVSAFLVTGSVDSRIDGKILVASRAPGRGGGAYAEAVGALLARGRQRHDVNYVIDHGAPGAMSRQVWRSVADDRAACAVAARVEVARAAQKTDAEQSLKGILLSRTATVNAKPELEIFADDVKCAHGATVGALDRAALFYLESRGIAPDEAEALLTRAFVADALDRVGEEAVRAAFYSDVEAWFGAAA